MRFAMVLLALAATLGQSGNDAAVAQGEQFLFVTTGEGQALGVVQAGVASFKGLPYASPPIGSLRWRAPQPPPVRWRYLPRISTVRHVCSLRFPESPSRIA
jgi:para-nitrobenzyl esterase